MDIEKDYYRILDINKDSTKQEVQQAYNCLKQQLHNSVKSNTEAASLIADINEAFEILSDSNERKKYDLLRIQAGYDKSLFICVKIISSHQKLKANYREQALYVLIEIDPAQDSPSYRPPLNLCIALDTSTSMQGARLSAVKEAAIKLMDLLHPNDAFSLVIFSDRAQSVISSQRNIDIAKSKAVISAIQPSGGTEILQGLRSGLNELSKWKSEETVNHLILLTDGQTYGDELACLEKADWARSNDIRISTMGIGTDWNEGFLDQVASITGGRSAYIDAPEKLSAAFIETMLNLTSMISRELSISLHLENGAILHEFYQINPFISEIKPANNLASIGPLVRDEEKILLIELRLGKQEVGHRKLLGLTIESKEVGLTHSPFGENEDVFADFEINEESDIDIPAKIIVALGHLAIYKMCRKAMADYASGQIAAAAERLEIMATRLLNIGETELARVALLEAGRLSRTGKLSSEGTKLIHYGTRALTA